MGLGPHRLNRALRPSWFFDKPAYGGIINDIGCHQIDQFLAFSGAEDAEIVTATIGCFGTEPPGFEDFADMTFQTPSVRGYARIDWFTADGLPTWGDGRLFVLGTQGTIEVRKNVDIAGRDGEDHVFLVDGGATRHIACDDVAVTYFSDFLADIAAGMARGVPQSHIFTVCRLALAAQALLAAKKIAVRVVSMPAGKVFDQQSLAYKNAVLPKGLPRIAVEMGVTDGWWKYGCAAVVGIDSYGESAPAPVLFRHFGFTPENVAETVQAVLRRKD